MKKYTTHLLFFVIAIAVSSRATAQKQGPILNHIALYVVDLKKSTSFYIDIVQIDTIPEPFHDGKHTWFRIGEKSHLHLIEGSKEIPHHDKNNHICFSVPSVENFAIRLEKYKISYSNWAGEKNKITVRVDGIKQIYFQDLDGNWIEINSDYQ